MGQVDWNGRTRREEQEMLSNLKGARATVSFGLERLAAEGVALDQGARDLVIKIGRYVDDTETATGTGGAAARPG